MREASIETHQHKGDLKELSRSGKSKELARDWEPAPKMKIASASPDWIGHLGLPSRWPVS